MNAYERVGRLEEALSNETQKLLSTIALLRRIKGGEVDIVDVSISENGWRLAIAKEPNRELRTAPDGGGDDGG